MDTRILIAGCGAVVQNLYRRPLRKLEKQGLLKVAALVDKDIDRAGKFGRNFSGARVFSSLESAIKESGSRMALITCPPAFHAEYSVYAMRSGCHVLCEKPMAVSSGQCRSMIEAARETGNLLSIGMSRRYWPSLAQAKEMIDAGEAGELISFSYSEGDQYNWPAATSSGFARKTGGGGILFDKGVHALDTLGWIFGRISVVSHSDDCMGNGVEASCITRLQAGDVKGVMHLSWDYDLKNELRIKGSSAEIVVPLDSLDEIHVKRNGVWTARKASVRFYTDASDDSGKTGVPRTLTDCFLYQLVQFVRAVRFGERISVGADECASTISLIEECYRIAGPLEMKWLPPGESSAFRRMHWRNRSWER